MADTHVAFLRAINVGGRRVAMDDLVHHLSTLPDVEVIDTYLASGNVSLRSTKAPAALEPAISEHLETALGFDVPTIVRSLDELRLLIASDQFAEQAAHKRYKLYVTFLGARSDNSEVLEALSNDVDTFALVHGDVFWLRDIEAGESMDNSALEKALGVVGTRRTMNTVGRIVKKLG